MRPGDVLDGRYVLDVMVGSGGMGAVYRARDKLGGRVVAVKVLRGYGQETAARFQREAELLASLTSPGIVGYFGFGTSDEGDTYMVLEWLEGETLKDRLLRAPLSLREAVTLVTGMADALATAHDSGVVHRDLKPANIFLVEGAVSGVKILDFGIARVLGGKKGMTVTGAVLGTPGYMAPEQIRGDKTLDARCDVYAMGSILFRCIAGRPPFEAPDTVSLLMKTATEAPPRLSAIRPSVPGRLDELVATMLRAKPEDRPRDARVVADELRLLSAVVTDDLQAPTLDAHAGVGLVPLILPDRTSIDSRTPPSRARDMTNEHESAILGPLASVERAQKRRFWRTAAVVLVTVFLVGIGAAAVLKYSGFASSKKRATPSARASASPGARTSSVVAPPPPTSAGPAPDARSFTYSVQPPAKPELAKYADFMRDKRLSAIVTQIDKNILLPDSVVIEAKQCEKEAALFDAKTRAITLCYELAEEFFDRFGKVGTMTDEARSQATLDAITFVMLHMIGHAVLSVGDLAVTGNEEVAVDEFATLIMIQMDHPEWVVNAAKAMLTLDRVEKIRFVGEHSITPERVLDLLCLVYGKDTTGQAALVGDPIPADRAPDCPAAFRQKDKAWTILLKDRLRPRP